MKIRYLLYPPLVASVIMLTACGQATQPEAPNLPKDVPGATQPYTGEAATGEAAKKPGLTVYQINPDGSSQQVLVPGLTQQPEGTGGAGAAAENNRQDGIIPDMKGMVITKEGFNPSSLTLKAGTKLIIQNSDDASHRPMSDPGTDCPGLNSDKPLAKGEFFEVVLTEPGTCGIHDDLNQQLKATITVTG